MATNVTKPSEVTMHTNNDGVTRDLAYWVEHPRELRAALLAEMAREEDPWVIVSISGRPAECTAAAMILFEGGREVCRKMAATIISEGGSDMPGVDHVLAVMPLAEWRGIYQHLTGADVG